VSAHVVSKSGRVHRRDLKHQLNSWKPSRGAETHALRPARAPDDGKVELTPERDKDKQLLPKL
jgi:hypothetical protein